MIKKFIRLNDCPVAEIKKLCIQILTTIDDMKSVFTDDNGEMEFHYKHIKKLLNRIINLNKVSDIELIEIASIKNKVNSLYLVMCYNNKSN